MVSRLPTYNRRVVLFVISFLQLFLDERVQSITKMTSANLALVMAPNLLRCESESMTIVFTNAPYVQFYSFFIPFTNILTTVDTNKCLFIIYYYTWNATKSIPDISPSTDSGLLSSLRPWGEKQSAAADKYICRRRLLSSLSHIIDATPKHSFPLSDSLLLYVIVFFKVFLESSLSLSFTFICFTSILPLIIWSVIPY